MKIGLRVDVDTLRGTKRGVPELLRVLDRHGVRAAFFFSVGPDNMGRHLWRLLKPQFLWKMLRTKAASLYGPEIIFMGTAWPGLKIGKRNADVIRDCAKAGHEIGVHAWDHHYWQAHAESMTAEIVREHMRRAFDELAQYAGQAPTCSAIPGWRGTETAVEVKDEFNFKYNSDCRGNAIFMPVINGKRLKSPQIPLSMPTYDELLGRDGVTNENYNERILTFAAEGKMNLLTIHAEVEGGICSEMFDRFLASAKERGIEFCSPEELLPADYSNIPDGRLVQGTIPGREGILCLGELIDATQKQ